MDAARKTPRLSSDELDAAIEPLRVGLVNAQYELRQRDFAAVVTISGDDSAAGVDALHSMSSWMDARYIEPHPLEPPSDAERERPWLWRYWQRLPANGRIAVFLEGWSTQLLRARLEDHIDGDLFDRRLDQIAGLEEMLAHGGTLVLKYWFHLGEDALRERLKKARKDPDRYWWVDPKAERRMLKEWERIAELTDHLLERTSSRLAPWQVIDSEHPNGRNLAFARSVHDGLEARLREERPEAPPESPFTPRVRTQAAPQLADVELGSRLSKPDYRERRDDLFAELRKLSGKAHREGCSTVLAFEGWDAAGKGGAIRRLTRPIDPRLLQVVPIAAPTPEEAAHHYLWRFWQHIPPAGKLTFFDRSWYGRVLVERVEALTPEPAWRRAYGEIRDFERQLTDFGILLLKFWIHIDEDEQLRRFQAREQTPFKKHKITEEDYRNRSQRKAYTQAVDEMVRETHSESAPWHLVAGNDKRHARIEILQTLVTALRRAV